MPVDDFQDFEGRYRNERRRLAESDIDDADRDAIKRFLNRVEPDVSTGAAAEYCKHLRLGAEQCDSRLVDLDADGFWAFRSNLLHEHGLGESTVYKRCQLVLRLLRARDVAWAEPIQLSSPDRPDIDPGAMLDTDDIAALRNAATYQRDIALIEFLADTGARIGMVGSLRVRDVDLEGDRPHYRPNPDASGLKGAKIQPYPIIDAEGALKAYIKFNHPRADDPNVAFFHKLQDWEETDGGLTAEQIRRRLRTLGKQAGIDKPVNPHNFRHSAITRMYREGYTKQQIQHRVAWDLDTDMWKRYVHLHAEDMNDTIYADAGMVDAENGATPRRKQCPNCRGTLPEWGDHCPSCGVPITHEAREAKATLEDLGLDALADGEKLTPVQRRALRNVLGIVRDEGKGHVDPSVVSSSNE